MTKSPCVRDDLMGAGGGVVSEDFACQNTHISGSPKIWFGLQCFRVHYLAWRQKWTVSCWCISNAVCRFSELLLNNAYGAYRQMELTSSNIKRNILHFLIICIYFRKTNPKLKSLASEKYNLKQQSFYRIRNDEKENHLTTSQHQSLVNLN